MKPISIAALLAASTLAIPALAQARAVTFTTTLKSYGGNGAYLAVYLTDAQGAYVRTLWVAGGKAKYYKHLANWQRLSARDGKRLDGVTGASVGGGRTLKVTADLTDVLLTAGLQVHVDAAVEDMRDSPSEIRAPLSAADAGKTWSGRQYIQSFSYQVQ